MKKTFLIVIFKVILFSGLSQELEIYSFGFEGFKNESYKGIVSLGDGYTHSGEEYFDNSEEDTLIIAPEHIGYNLERDESSDLRDRQYHILDNQRRKRKLESVGISEEDTIFIYRIGDPVVLKFPVKETNVVAFINIYWYQEPARSHDYVVGFEIYDLVQDTDIEFWSALAFIGKENPFQPDKALKLDFEEITGKEITRLKSEIDSIFIDTSTRAIYADTLTYLAYGLNPDDIYSTIQHMVVYDEKNDKIVYDEYYRSSESRSPATKGNQWSGAIVKGRPPVMLGFYYYTFDCPSINFIGKDEKPIWIFCDNRH